MHLALVDQLFHRARRHFFTSLGDHFTSGSVNQIIGWTRSPYPLWEKLGHPALTFTISVTHCIVISIHDPFLVQTKRVKKCCNRELTSTIDTRIDDIFGVELKIEPRSTIWNNAAREQQFTRAVGFALVMIEEDARRAVHLGNDHTLCSVDDESTVWRHQWHIAHENVLFFDVFHRFCTCLFVDIKDDQAQSHLQRCAVGHITLLTFLNVILWLFQIVVNKLKNGGLIEIFDWKDGLKHAFDTLTIHWLRSITRVQE